jgi:hypothetical protein
MIETNELPMETEDQAQGSADAPLGTEEMPNKQLSPEGTINTEIREDPNNI